MFQPLMGEPSLWNVWFLDEGNYALEHVSTPHGRAVPLELPNSEEGLPRAITSFNPSWESRPSGTPSERTCNLPAPWCFNPSWESRPSGTPPYFRVVDGVSSFSTPQGRAVPLKLVPRLVLRVSAQVSTPHGRAVPLEPRPISGMWMA